MLALAAVATSVDARSLLQSSGATACCAPYSRTVRGAQTSSFVAISDTSDADCATIANNADHFETTGGYCLIPFTQTCAALASDGIQRYSGSISACGPGVSQSGASVLDQSYSSASSGGGSTAAGGGGGGRLP